jgi:opacity protein-like surface antigen
MQRSFTTVLAALVMLAVASSAHAQGNQVQGFGGLTFGDVTNSSTFGGSLAIPLTDNVQIIGEGGRMTDVMPTLFDDILDFTPVDVRVSAWYGEGGVRFIGSSNHVVRPYVEATAGVARLNTGFDGPGDDFINTALGFFGETEPLLGVGGGVLFQGGPVFLDLGYRYKKILVGDSIQTVLTGGDFSVNQFRIGAGVRF